VDKENQNVIGIVTQRRFLGASNLQNISSQIEQVSRYCHQISNRGSVFISGIDFGQFAQLMADSLLIGNKVIKANANSGIGIGFNIKFVTMTCESKGII